MHSAFNLYTAVIRRFILMVLILTIPQHILPSPPVSCTSLNKSTFHTFHYESLCTKLLDLLLENVLATMGYGTSFCISSSSDLFPQNYATDI